jgi:hypothetical protein
VVTPISASTDPLNGVPELAGVVQHVLRSPRTWVLRYLLATIPSVVFAVMFMYPLRPWFRIPLLVRGLETRSLDQLLEAIEFSVGQIVHGLPLVVTMLLIPLGWILVQVVWVFIEGGILATYAEPGTLSWREFIGRSWYWFGSLLLLGVIWFAAAVPLGVLTILLGSLAGSLWHPLSMIVLIIGVVSIVVLWIWFSLARSVTVVRDDRNVFHALRSAARVIRQRPVGVLVLVVVTLTLQAVLVWTSRVGTVVLPYAWWLPALILQQMASALAMGLTLARRAGEIGLAAQVFPQEEAEVA